MSDQLPVYEITRDGIVLGEFVWDSSRTQLRKTDDPLTIETIDDPLIAALLDNMPIGKYIFATHVKCWRLL